MWSNGISSIDTTVKPEPAFCSNPRVFEATAKFYRQRFKFRRSVKVALPQAMRKHVERYECQPHAYIRKTSTTCARPRATIRSLNPAKTAEMPRRAPLKDVPIASNVHWLVLALVIEKPSYGYEIGERYDRRFGTFLPSLKTGIYSSLDRLEQAGIIEALPPSPELAARARRIRRIYGPAHNAARLHALWLSSPVSSDRWRDDLLARIGTAHLQGPAFMRELLGRYAQHAAIHEQRIQALISDRAAVAGTSRQALSAIILLREQREMAATQRRWAQHVRDELANCCAAGRPR
jgi:DNA-binding PadR family transcriptional regulator